MPIDLYHMEISAPCRAVRFTAKELGVELNLKVCNLFAKEQMTPEFLKLNPQHTIPTMVDGDYSLGESRAIMCYLANAYGKGNKLYPECPKMRGTIDRFLYFDIGTLFKAFGDFFFPQMFMGKPADPACEEKLKEALDLVGTFLGDKTYLTGDQYTLADIAVGSTLTMMEIINFPMPPKVEEFYKRMKKLPGWGDVHNKGIEEFKGFIASKKQ